MANFWEFESKSTHQQRLAEQWTQKAKEDAWEKLGHDAQRNQGLSEEAIKPLSEGNDFAQRPFWELDNQDLNKIEPETKQSEKKGGGILGDIGSFIDDATSTVFGGPIRQPWDVLRPVQRAMEAEQKYVARPIAKAALSPFGDYDSLPGIVRAGAETLFDPLTYLGPGAVGEVFKGAKMLSAGEKIALPGLMELVQGPGSRRAMQYVIEQAAGGLAAVGGGTLAEELGLPGVVGSIAAPAGLQHLMGRVPGTMPVVSKMVDNSDLDPAVRELLGLDKTAESTGMKAVSQNTKPSRIPSFVADLEPGKTVRNSAGQRDLAITAKGDGLYDVTEKGKSLMQGEFENTFQDVSYDDLKMRYDTGAWPSSVTQPTLQNALKAEDTDLEAYFNEPARRQREIDSQMSTNVALSSTPEGRAILVKKTKGEPLSGADYNFISEAARKAANPECAQ
jgi:hypothetical protein